MPTSLGNTLLIANPTAQRGNGARATEIACDLLRQWLGEESFAVARTKRAKHAVGIAAQASEFDTVIALGGDGIVHEVVNGLMRISDRTRPLFGLIPVGSGNDYARTLGMAENVPDAIVQLLDAREERFDVGCCNDEFFAETLSFGLDAAIALDTVERRKRTGEQGTILYLKSGIDQLLHHLDSYEFTAMFDGTALDGAFTREVRGAMHMLAIQVGPTYGGGFRICPEADPCDGLLDVCYADAPMSVAEATFKFLRAKNAHHTKFKNIHFERATRIELSFDKRPPCQIDGEAFIADSYRISIMPSALRVLTATRQCV